MKSLEWIKAENAETDRRIAAKQASSLRRLKQRIARLTRSSTLATSRREMRAQINAAIDAWAAAERKRAR